MLVWNYKITTIVVKWNEKKRLALGQPVVKPCWSKIYTIVKATVDLVSARIKKLGEVRLCNIEQRR